MNQRLPNLIIAGAGKSGTTSLFMYLKQHPEICGSRIKETHYFTPLRSGDRLPPIEEYRQHFEHCAGQKYILEATPGYLYGSETVARAIKQEMPDTKIIMIVREPIARLISLYRFLKALVKLPKTMEFHEFIQVCETQYALGTEWQQETRVYWGINAGLYSQYLPSWFDTFGDLLKITFFENLRASPILFLNDISDFLEISPVPFHDADLSIENKSMDYKNRHLQKVAYSLNLRGEKFWRDHHGLKKALRKAYYAVNGNPFDEQLLPETINYLDRLYAPYNEQLALQLTNWGYKDLPDWCSYPHTSEIAQ